MNSTQPLLFLGLGLGLGAVAVWLLLRARMAGTISQVRAEFQAPLATLTERINGKDKQLAELENARAAEEDQKTQLAMQLQQESNSKVAAETRAIQLEEQLKSSATQAKETELLLETERRRSATVATQFSTAKAQLDAERETLQQLRQEHLSTRTGLDKLQGELLAQKRQNGELTEKARFLEERLGTQRQEIEAIQQKFYKEFEAVSHKLLVESSTRFGQQSAEGLDKLLGPFRENLKEFRAKLETVHQDATTHTALLKDQIARIGTEAANLSKALKGDVKVLGNWGENMLDRILERSGLQLGVHYRRQSAAKDAAGDQRFLDVVVNLGDGKHLIIDSKVSLKSYEGYVNAVEDLSRQRSLLDHIECIRRHLRDLGAKRYQDTHGINTPDFVLMYIPIEAAFFVAVAYEPGLFSEAFDRNVVLVTNSTLLATLCTVAGVWCLAEQRRNALEIARRGGELYDKFVGLLESLRAVGKCIKDAGENYETAMNRLHEGRGNLLWQVEQLKALGVKPTKVLPRDLQEKAAASSEIVEIVALPGIEAAASDSTPAPSLSGLPPNP